jgi:hypothetical protein
VLLIVTAVVLVKAGNSESVKKSAFVTRMMDLAKIIVTALAFLIGGAAVTTTMTACSVRRAITVQGTIISSETSDSTRVIISSQESYVGAKKK